jgi:Holliday junction resolvase RusA-like endonuclease
MMRVTLADAIRAPETPRHAPNATAPRVAATLTVPVPPSANEWHRHVGSRVLLSSAARKYVKGLAQHIPDMPPFTGPIRVEIRWYRARRAGDVDKRGGILLDALQGLAYANDSQIADYRIVRDDSQPKAARMVVTITPLGEP